jgi:ubiquinone/menaquinone biosynthesis C-methylase UbiE
MFETEGREVFEKREAIIAALDICPGMAIADVGVGTGVFSLPLSRKVGITGKVIAQDISPEFLRGIEARARKENLPQLVSLLGAEK